MARYPFGQPVLPCPPSADSARSTFVLGAYPSALHVAWRAPSGSPAIRAIPIDNEPTPFWIGDDADALIEQWKADVSYEPDRHGIVTSAGNGTSGRTLDDDYLRPLGVSRADAWITDCVDTYFVSDAARKRLPDIDGHCRANGLPVSQLAGRPTDATLLAQATSNHRDRLRSELATAKPSTIITLGDVAAAVLMSVLDRALEPRSLALVPEYGSPTSIDELGGATWLRLAHPRALRTKKWAGRHRTWQASISA